MNTITVKEQVKLTKWALLACSKDPKRSPICGTYCISEHPDQKVNWLTCTDGRRLHACMMDGQQMPGTFKVIKATQKEIISNLEPELKFPNSWCVIPTDNNITIKVNVTNYLDGCICQIIQDIHKKCPVLLDIQLMKDALSGFWGGVVICMKDEVSPVMFVDEVVTPKKIAVVMPLRRS